MSHPNLGGTSARVAARVDLKPLASQTFLVSLLLLAIVCIVSGTMLLSLDKVAGWAIAGLSIPFAVSALWGWRSSQSDTDLQTAIPTTLSLPDGTTVSTDSRTLRSEIAMQGLLRLCEAQQRKTLPDADGIVEDGQIVPKSAAAAKARTQQINADVDNQARNFEALVNRSEDGPSVIQRPRDINAPPEASTSIFNKPAQS